MQLLRIFLILLFLGVCILADLMVGTANISFSNLLKGLFNFHEDVQEHVIIQTIRIPRVITAISSGAGLAICGLMMQTLFRNPLAGPSVLGITSGSSLAVAVVGLAGATFVSGMGVVFAAFFGAMGVLGLILLADMRTKNAITLLIIGLMVGYLCSALVSILAVNSNAQGLKGFVLWGFGSFDGVDAHGAHVLLVIVSVGLLLVWAMANALNGISLGEEQARTIGVSVTRVKRIILALTGIITATVTAFAGPIAFLGLAVPHLARAAIKTNNHKVLVPLVALTGATVALLCDMLRHLPEQGTIPLNAVASFIGAPVVLWILIKGRKWFVA